MDEQKRSAAAAPKEKGTPFKEMSGGRKVLFICKLALCILTFGMAFPNVMAD
jgi:hypothetical protein